MEYTKKVKSRVVGVDISIEATTYAIVDVRGNIIAQESFPTPLSDNLDVYISELCERIMRLIAENDSLELVRSVGVCCASSNYETGCIENAPNLPWKGIVPLAAMMRDRLGLAVALANNSQCIALGEQSFGSAHGMKDFVIITIGHGLGSCIFSNGKMHLGNKGFAGEVGHACVVPNGRECGCGRHGCLEAYCADKGIVRTALELMEECNEPSLMRQETKLTPKKVVECCEQGDELAIETYRRAGYMLGLGLANYASIINPEAFIFAGGVALAGKWLLEPAGESFDQHVFHNIVGKVKFLQSPLVNHLRNMLGASVLAWEVQEYSLFK